MRGMCAESKRLRVANVLKEGSLNLLALCETKMKGSEEFVRNGIHCVRSGMKGGGVAKARIWPCYCVSSSTNLWLGVSV